MNQEIIKHRIVYVHLNNDYVVKKGNIDIKELTDEGYNRALQAQRDGIIAILEHKEIDQDPPTTATR